MSKVKVITKVYVYFKKLHEDAVLPTQSHENVGLDLTTIDNGVEYDNYIEYKFGLAAELPSYYFGLICPRSSITKYDLLLKNSLGILDYSYRGEIATRFYRTEYTNNIYKKGDRIAQLIILPYPMITTQWKDELDKTDRGTGGFGSTGQ